MQTSSVSGTGSDANCLVNRAPLSDFRRSEPRVRESAIGAIRHALTTVDVVPVSMRFGLYSGWAGIAYAAARIGLLVGDDEFVDEAEKLLRRLEGEDLRNCERDLLSGFAGAIVALMALPGCIDDRFRSVFSVQLGDELLNSAVESQGRACWRSVSLPHQPGLTGVSHGAAGVGMALLELWRITGDSKFRAAAMRAFEYERHWFDEEEGNWPDLRTISRQRRQASVPLQFSATWCHGAPGIALARLRAMERCGSASYRGEAVRALDTTGRAVEAHLRLDTGNYSLCHGLAGNADILLEGFEMLGREEVTYRSLAHHVARTGIERHSGHGQRWPCGTRGETPSLMLGLAGIGYFYLRVSDPSLPSVLAVACSAPMVARNQPTLADGP